MIASGVRNSWETMETNWRCNPLSSRSFLESRLDLFGIGFEDLQCSRHLANFIMPIDLGDRNGEITFSEFRHRCRNAGDWTNQAGDSSRDDKHNHQSDNQEFSNLRLNQKCILRLDPVIAYGDLYFANDLTAGMTDRPGDDQVLTRCTGMTTHGCNGKQTCDFPNRCGDDVFMRDEETELPGDGSFVEIPDVIGHGFRMHCRQQRGLLFESFIKSRGRFLKLTVSDKSIDNSHRYGD